MNSQRVRLEIHASKLSNVAGTFKTSDPYAVVTLLSNNPKEQPRVLGKTEVIPNSLNPRWVTHFDLDYCIGELTRINVGVYDNVKKGTHKPMGSAMFEVGEVLGSRGNIKAKQLRNGGTLFVRIQAAPASGFGSLQLRLCGYQLKNVDGIFGTSDPFFELSYNVRDSAGGLTWQPVYRSEPIKNDLNPRWPACSLDLGRLCGGDFNQPIQFKLYDWQKNGKHAWMGTFETNVNAILGAVVAEPVDMNNVDTSKAFMVFKRGKLAAGKVIVTEARVDGRPAVQAGSYVAPTYTSAPLTYAPAVPAPEQYIPPPATSNSSSFAMPAFSQALAQPPLPVPASSVSAMPVLAPMPTSPAPPPPPPAYLASPLPSPGLDVLPPPIAPPEQKPSFVDYLSGGLDIEMCIAIDFTGSNGDPRVPGTLHYMNPSGQLNDYEKAITAVGGILGRYDTNQRFATWGFGAKQGGNIQHCFQVGSEAELHRISSVLEAYRNIFKSGLIMSGPTVFAEVIDMAAAKARSSFESGSRVGRQVYTLLLILTDGEVSDINLTKHSLHSASDAPLSVVIVGMGNADFSSMNFLDNFQANAGGRYRDVCHFVEFNRYQNDKQALTRVTLQEIPEQLVNYFWSRGISPLPPLQDSQMNVTPDAPTEEDMDLNLSFGANGDISLADNSGAVFDDTKYSSSLSSFAKPGTYRPSASHATNNYVSAPPMSSYLGSTAPYKASASISGSSSSFNPSSSIGVAGGPYVSNASSSGTGTTTPMSTLSPYSNLQSTSQSRPGALPLQTQPPKMFQVQAPPNSYPGMQLQVRNPFTGEALIVKVPNGVAPGGRFGVR